MKEGFSQAAYDKFLADQKSATLKAQGGSYGGGSETLIVSDTKGFPLGFRAENTRLYDETATTLCSGTRPGYCNGVIQIKSEDVPQGVDGYNATLTGDKSSTLGVNCGMSTGRNGVCAFHGQASHAAGISASEEVAPTLMNAKQVDVATEAIVRRLTPLECERLQGFPDGWTNIGEWIDGKGKKHKDSDSPRYKALGNSIAIPPWYYVLQKLSLCCGDDTTMASLFDGIGGFPLIWEMLNGKGSCLWASEIEDFPIAVTQIRFSEEV